MKRFWKAGVIALAAAGMFAAALAPAAAQQQSRLDKIIASKTLRVGIILSLPPFGMKNDAGEPDGFDVDVAKLAAEKLGAKLEIVDTTAADRIPNLRTDKVDMIIGQFTRNSERAKVVSFSDPYITAVVMAIAVPKDSTAAAAKDLDGKRVAVIKGTTQDATFSAAVPGADIQRFDSSAAALLALKQGQVDAMVNLALMYEGGQGTTSDLTAAANWYGRAAKLGDGFAEDRLKLVNEALATAQAKPLPPAVDRSIVTASTAL